MLHAVGSTSVAFPGKTGKIRTSTHLGYQHCKRQVNPLCHNTGLRAKELTQAFSLLSQRPGKRIFVMLPSWTWPKIYHTHAYVCLSTRSHTHTFLMLEGCWQACTRLNRKSSFQIHTDWHCLVTDTLAGTFPQGVTCPHYIRYVPETGP